MSYETLPTDLRPHLTMEEDVDPRINETEFQTGDKQVWPQDHLIPRVWMWQWSPLNEDEIERLTSFIRAHAGAQTPFYWEPVDTDPIPRPYMGPALEKKTGGSVGSRTLYAAYTWSDGSNETTPSAVVTSISLASTETIKATTKPFPEGVTEAIVYVGTSSTYANLHKQTPVISVVADGWAEPATGYDSGGAAPPTTNTLTETPLVYAIEDSLSTDRLQHNAWQASLRVAVRRGG